MLPKWSLEVCKTSREPPKSLPRRLKMAPKRLQDAPSSTQDAPKTTPRPPKRLQERSRCLQVAPRASQDAPKTLRDLIFGHSRAPEPSQNLENQWKTIGFPRFFAIFVICLRSKKTFPKCFQNGPRKPARIGSKNEKLFILGLLVLQKFRFLLIVASQIRFLALEIKILTFELAKNRSWTSDFDVLSIFDQFPEDFEL